MTTRPSLWLTAALAVLSAAAHAQTVRVHGGGAFVTDRLIDGTTVLRTAGAARSPLASRPTATTGTSPVCGATAVDWQGQALPDGESGTLDPLGFFHSATINRNGRIAFVAKVDGAPHNQGIFTADAEGLHIVALGCGGDGGSGAPDTCGDASPLGGTFGGFFMSTFSTPDLNANGDVVFLADVVGGSAPRGLFLYRALSDDIVTVAAVGDASPLGGTLTAIGSGDINDAGTIAFIAITDGADSSDIFLWQDGTVTKYVAAGDPAPGGGTFSMLGTERWGFADGTEIPGGPMPSLNENGDIAFRGYVSGGAAAGGMFLSHAGTHEWLVAAGDAAPGGGNYADFAAPLLNDQGEIAFYSDVANGESSSAWFAGNADGWRRVLAALDPLDGGQVWGMAFSRSPMRAIADNGDVVLWTSILMPDQSERGTLVLSHPDGSVDVLARQGDESPIGGFWGGSMDAWPSINDAGQVRVGSATPGFGDALSADVVLTLCAGDVVFRDGFDGF